MNSTNNVASNQHLTMSVDEILALHPLPWTHNLLLIKDANGNQVIHNGGLYSEYGRLYEGKYLSGLNALLVGLVNARSRVSKDEVVATEGDKHEYSIQSDIAIGKDWLLYKGAAERIVARISDNDCLVCKHWDSDAVYAIAVELATSARTATASPAAHCFEAKLLGFEDDWRIRLCEPCLKQAIASDFVVFSCAAPSTPVLHWPFAPKHDNCSECAKEYEPPPTNAPAVPKEEAPQHSEVRSSRHPHFTHADHERMKETLDALSEYPTEEEAEAALQACGTSGKEVVNEFIERLLKENLELKNKLDTATPSPDAARESVQKAAEEIAKRWVLGDIPEASKFHAFRQTQLQTLAEEVLSKHFPSAVLVDATREAAKEIWNRIDSEKHLTLPNQFEIEEIIQRNFKDQK